MELDAAEWLNIMILQLGFRVNRAPKKVRGVASEGLGQVSRMGRDQAQPLASPCRALADERQRPRVHAPKVHNEELARFISHVGRRERMVSMLTSSLGRMHFALRPGIMTDHIESPTSDERTGGEPDFP